ncbi:hypothetical protein ERJ70_02505 [Sediminibacillus dalangtanensis]|uniref:NIPSNAP domain-containing protein n=1 Tax=Sediminibacillus dalangtanensis TaxID=2729421 RepID=A0ABX7VN72_9BACI|nr:NIPSNAP family protein [Sediminibacillus dalangtanensis]QTM98284.1 hypothetical protein ERJ70_02505 [Sediminibacillus dalangtanensis]
MIYRRKTYHIDPIIKEEFNEHFNKTLLPTQLKYGARLVGRWMTKANNVTIEIFAMWEYQSYEEYEKIESKIRADKGRVNRVEGWFEKMGGREKLKAVFFKIDQDFLESTVPRDKTIMAKKP